jgi:hypothetical protein
MIFSENRFPSRIKSGTGFFGLMLDNASQTRVTALMLATAPR